MNRILFVCRENIGRSQAAAGLYNQLIPEYADSAGTQVSNTYEKIGNIKVATNIIKIMGMYGIDISGNLRQQVEETTAEDYDKIIVMAEQETIPIWLLTHPRAENWAIQDLKNQNLNNTKAIVNIIHNKVSQLAKVNYLKD